MSSSLSVKLHEIFGEDPTIVECRYAVAPWLRTAELLIPVNFFSLRTNFVNLVLQKKDISNGGVMT